MLLSCNKLKSYIKNSNDIDWENIWKTFTIRTAEVESVKKVGNNLDNVVIAKIVKCEKHPDSDHMHILQVECDEENPVQVVCGAPNVRVGLKTAYIKVGGHIEGIEIKSRPLRGIISNGMCCSGKELGISDNHDGILELPSDAPVGMNIKEYLPIEDIIVEIDNKSLTNRPDLWGHYGIAREIAAITNHELLPLEISEIEDENKEKLKITIKEPNLCYRYSGLKVNNLTNNKTPLDMQIFLYYVGMRSISLFVDLTNYIMLELGQPMHAFDSRVVKEIEVGLANDGYTYTTLDGIERKLTKDMLMIKNGNNYFGIAGVMGGLDSEILSDTTSIFLESATFNAGNIRKTAVALGLRTEASARYEKSLDPNLTTYAIKRLMYLLKKENPNLEIASKLTDIYPNELTEQVIKLNKKTLKIYMGKELSENEIKEILEKLGFKVEINKDFYNVTVPTFRATKDIKIEQDLIEEIARMYGLENFSPKPLKLDLTVVEHENVYNQEYEVKGLLATKFDMNEVNSYIWYDSEMLKKIGIDKSGIKLLGKSENNILRDDLSLSLMNIIENNLKNYKRFGIFEIGTTIENNSNRRKLSIILVDDEKNIENIYMNMKAIVKYLFKNLKNKNVTFVDNINERNYYEDTLGKKVIIDDEVIGELNVLSKRVANKIGKKKAIVCTELDFDKYVDIEKNKILAKDISKYPTVELDYTIIMPDNKKYIELLEVLKAFKSNLIQSYNLLGTYENKYTIRYIIGSDHKTLDQKDLSNFKERFIEHIKNNGLSIIE